MRIWVPFDGQTQHPELLGHTRQTVTMKITVAGHRVITAAAAATLEQL
ncbi:MAG: hypothetical protein IPG74_14535 [Flavobacteriales bacterium]|nr:hypothetical protein [Flavobacteriales bacterium]